METVITKPYEKVTGDEWDKIHEAKELYYKKHMELVADVLLTIPKELWDHLCMQMNECNSTYWGQDIANEKENKDNKP
jgi:hypothetical protein